MRNISKFEFWTGITLQTLNSLVAEARERAVADAKSCHHYIKSRGVMLATLGKDGQCAPAAEAEAFLWKGTGKEIAAIIEDVQKNYPEVTDVYLSIGYDGSESFQCWLNGDYEPWVANEVVTVWKRR